MNHSHIELRHLRLLQAVAESGGLTAAAERLHLTQSAVSHQLKALEDTLGLSLVERAIRPLGLTAAGRRLLALANTALPQVNAALRDLAKLKDGDAGELRIAVECHTCYDWLMPAMDSYRDVWPGVELDLLGGFQADPVGLLLDQQADLVITSESAPRAGVPQPAHRRVFIGSGRFGKHTRLGLGSNVLGDLRNAVDAGGLVEVACAIQQRQLDAGHLGKTGITFHPVELIGLIELCEGLGGLVEKLEAMAPDFEVPQLLGHDHLKDHGGLVR